MWYLRNFAFLVLSALIVMLIPATFLFLNLEKTADSLGFLLDMVLYVGGRVTLPYLALYFPLVLFLEHRHISNLRPYILGGGIAGALVLVLFCLLNPIGQNNYLPLAATFVIAGVVTAWLHRKIKGR